MNTIKYTITLMLFAFCLAVTAQPNIYPAGKQTESIKIDGATLHIGNGEVLENAVVVFDQGKITYVGSKADAPSADKNIDATGKHVYPGFIAPNTNLGLVEFAAVKATVDFAETGENNAHIRSIIAYNTDSKVINTLRSNGILLAQITPQRGMISGQSSVVHLDAWNWEDAVVKMDEGLHIQWPELPRRIRSEEAKKRFEKRSKEQIDKLFEFFLEAKAYTEIDKNEKIFNARLEAATGIFNQEKQVFVHVNSAKEIQKSVLKFTEIGIRPIVVGGANAHWVTDILKQYNIPVILNHTHSLPEQEHDDILGPYRQAKKLYDEKILFAYSVVGSDAFWNQRNLPFMAGTAVAHGLPYEQGVASISYNVAKILGIDKKTGSIEVGKSADLFISTGDALDMRGNKLEQAFIQGRSIKLDNWHEQLHQRYKDKYEANK